MKVLQGSFRLLAPKLFPQLAQFGLGGGAGSSLSISLGLGGGAGNSLSISLGLGGGAGNSLLSPVLQVCPGCRVIEPRPAFRTPSGSLVSSRGWYTPFNSRKPDRGSPW